MSDYKELSSIVCSLTVQNLQQPPACAKQKSRYATKLRRERGQLPYEHLQGRTGLMGVSVLWWRLICC